MKIPNQNVVVKKIIDVSRHNGIIDWPKVKQGGIKDVIIRLSMGYNAIDPKAVQNAKEAFSAGLKVSYYHFAYPDLRTGSWQGDAKQEAGYFTGLFAGGLLPNPQWLALDLEKWDEVKNIDTPLTNPQFNEWVTVFLSEVKTATGTTCMIYSNKYYLDQHLPPDHQLGNYPLWISNYNKGATPPLPRGWTKYFLWQYTSTASVKGITGNCDMSRLG